MGLFHYISHSRRRMSLYLLQGPHQCGPVGHQLHRCLLRGNPLNPSAGGSDKPISSGNLQERGMRNPGIPVSGTARDNPSQAWPGATVCGHIQILPQIPNIPALLTPPASIFGTFWADPIQLFPIPMDLAMPNCPWRGGMRWSLRSSSNILGFCGDFGDSRLISRSSPQQN